MDSYEEVLEVLIRLGLRHGALTYEELNDGMPTDFTTVEIDRVLADLQARGIDVVDRELAFRFRTPIAEVPCELCDRGQPMPAGGRQIAFVLTDERGERRSARLDRWRNDAHMLRGPDEVVASTAMHLFVRYPLRVGAKFTVASESPLGFTRLELFARIGELYAHIYRVEQRTTTLRAQVVTRGGNVSPTTGTFGIWGHPLDHLVLDGAWSTIGANGETIWPVVGS